MAANRSTIPLNADQSSTGESTPSRGSLGAARNRNWALDVAYVTLSDEDAGASRKIATDSPEFRANYVDYNVVNAYYWSTSYAAYDSSLRDFVLEYRDKRLVTFSLDAVPVRHARGAPEGRLGDLRTISSDFNAIPSRYFKRHGFIYPPFYNQATAATLIDIATTIAFNHRQREQFREVAEVTTFAAVVLSYYAFPPDVEKMIPLARGGYVGTRPIRSCRGDSLAAAMRAKHGKVGVNLGGRGSKAEAAYRDYININDLSGGEKPGTIPNLIYGKAEDIASYFSPGVTLDHIVAENIVPGTMDWFRVAKGTFTKLRQGSVIELAEFGGGDLHGLNIKMALEAAGFEQVEILFETLVRGLKP